MMTAFGAAMAWVEGSGVAIAIRESLLLTAALSAFHLIGATLVGGGALLGGLRIGGVLFPDQAMADVVRPAGRAILLGLSISIVTGALLFSPRASMAVANGFFQLKMGLLVAAAACHAILHSRRWHSEDQASVFLGLARSMLYIAVILAGSAYILLE